MAKPKYTTSRWPWRRGRMFWGTALLSFGVCSGVLWGSDPVEVPVPPGPGQVVLPPPVIQTFTTAPAFAASADEPKTGEEPIPRGVAKPAPSEEPAAKEPKKIKPVADTGPVTLSQGTTPKQKLHKFEMRGELWQSVMDWYVQASGLPFVSTVKPPTGTFNFTPLKVDGKSKEYTIAEVTDILNEALIEKGYIILRGEASFTLHPADTKIDPTRVPHVTTAGLYDRGSKEVCQLVFEPTPLIAEDLVPEIKPLLGPFGQVSALKEANQLVMLDQAGNLRRVVEMIKSIVESDKNAETYTHRCRFVLARDAEAVLKKMLGDPMDAFRALAAQQARDFGRGDFGRGDFGRGDFGRGDFGRGDFGRGDFGRGDFGRGPDFGRGDSNRQPTPVVATPRRIHTITCDEVRNTVMVSGPANKIAMAKQILAKYDVGDKEIIVDPDGPSMKMYTVMPGTAEVMATTLKDIFKSSPTIRIAAVGANQIMVWAPAEDHFQIKKHIGTTLDTKSTATKLIALQSLDAKTTVDTLAKMFGDSKAGGPYLEADTNRNALIVRATPDQIRDVESAVKVLEGDPSGGENTRNMRIITLDKGSAINMAEALQRLYQQMDRGPVKIITPNFEFGPAPKPAEPKPPMKENRGTDSQPQKDKSRSSPEKGERVTERQFGEPAQMLVAHEQPLFDPQAKKDKGKSDGKAPVTITAVGGKLIVQTDDPEAMAVITELIRLLRAEPGEGDFTVFRLKYANAVEAARILDQWFNPQQQQQQQRGLFPGIGIPLPFPFGGQRGGGGGGSDQPATPNRVRIVADPNSNSLLVRASVLDLMTIDSMLKKAIDNPDVDSDALAKPHFVPLKYASALDVAQVIRDVFRENMATGGSSTGGMATFGFPFGQRQQQTSTERSPRAQQNTLAVGVDDRSNTLVVNCSDNLYKEIEVLVKKLDDAAENTGKAVKVVSIKGVDPVLVQEAIDAIQGRTIRRDQQGQFGTGRGGQQQQGGTRGGFSPPFGGGNFGSPFGGGNFGAPFGGNRGGGPGGGGPGGGGPFGGNRGGGNRGNNFLPEPDGGPDFFEYRGMDAPPAILFDPQLETNNARIRYLPLNFPGPRLENTELARAVAAAAFQQKDETDPKKGAEPKKEGQPPKKEGALSPDDIRAPRGTVNAQALEELGIVVISAQNAADLEVIMELIKYIVDKGKDSEVELRLVPLQQGDPTVITNIMNQVLSRVNLSAGGNIALPTVTQRTQPQVGFQFPGGAAFQQQQQQAPATGVLLLPIPRFNSILVGAPKVRMDDIVKQIKDFDRPNAVTAQPNVFPLRNASAQILATQINQFYAQRYPGETATGNQVRATFDTRTNSITVQASPADLEEIRGLIERVDSTVSNAVNELRIFRLRNALSDELANTILSALTQGVLPQSAATTGTGTTPGQTGGPLGGGPLGGGPLGGGPLGGGPLGGGPLGGTAPGGQRGTALGGALSGAGAAGYTTKTVSLRFVSPGKGGVVESGFLEDVHITADVRTNSLIVSAPPRTIALVEALVRDLDTTSAATSRITIFTMRKGVDAAVSAALLQQLFLGTSRTGTQPGGGLPLGGQTFGQQTGAQGTSLRPLLSLTGEPAPGAQLVNLSIAVDDRTNSIIVAGSPNDIEAIETIINFLQDSPVQDRRNEVIKLKHASAVDMATALQPFFTNSLTVIRNAGLASAFAGLQREIVVVAEPVSNTLIVNATPDAIAQVLQVVERIDAQPPQVVIQVLVAEVQLTNTHEFGVEIGLQAPVLFQRSIIPTANGFSLANATGSVIPPGVTVNSTASQAAFPGFNFNTTQQPPGFNNQIGPGIVGYQGLGNLGVGRANSVSGIGGFVFSGASNTFNLLIRALATQGRIDILSRPQITCLDSQTGYIQVGQSFPYVTGSTANGLTGVITPTIAYRDVGISLQVTPRITPENKVIMRVEPVISAPQTTTINLGGGLLATVFDQQQVQTTVLAGDGETIAIGGLITKNKSRQENKIPWFGDLPIVGSAFRFRTQTQFKRELLVILTPHIIRCEADAARVIVDESKRMDWILKEVEATHASSRPPGPHPPASPTVVPGTIVPGSSFEPPAAPSLILPAPQPATPPAPMPMPPGKAAPSTSSAVPPQQTVAQASATTAASAGPALVNPFAQPATPPAAAGVEPGVNKPQQDGSVQKERQGWNLFRRNK